MDRCRFLAASVLVAVLAIVLPDAAAGQYGTFDFNDGTAQGWWLDGAYDENGNGPFSSAFTFSWWDMVNYPNIPFNDPSGDGNGSVMLFTSGGHGINNPSGTWWIMQFHSPDLSGSSTWQGATGYSVELADAMSVGGTLYCNLYVKVYDYDQGHDRYFYNGTAQPMQHYQTQAWNYFSFDDWSAIPGFPTNYTVKEVFVNIWGLMTDLVEGAVFLDEVVPVSNPPVLSVTPTVLDFGTTLTNLDFYISNIGGGSLNWSVAESPDKPWITSVWPADGTNDATVTVTVDRTFLVGDSDSGTLSVTSNGGDQDVTVLIERESYVNVTAPQAGEDWPIGSTRHIQWTSSGTSGFVMIEISRDGGSIWTTVEGSTADDGDYVWTVTGPASNNCVIRVTDTDGSPSGTSGTFSISEQPYVTVTSPSTGDDWQIGTQQHIQWSSSGTSGSVAIEISRDGGGTWSTIESSTTDDGDHPWTVTGPPSTNCVVRVSDTDGDPSGTSGVFTISQESFVTVTSPQAGDDWPIGSNQDIQWSSSGTSGTVAIEISRDGGVTWETIESSTADDGDHTWTVTGPASADCAVKVSDTDGDPSGTSGTFTVSEQPYIMVTAPEAGTEWTIGETEQIQWTSSGTSGLVAIEISRDGGGTWSTIESSIGDEGDYPWIVTGPASPSCQIRVTDVDGTPSGMSGTFSISEAAYITVIAPPNGAEWQIGTANSILWASVGTSGTVEIALSRDAGATWATVEPSTSDDGDYVWTVTGPTSESCVVRIRDGDGSPEGLSGTFTIFSTAADDPVLPGRLALDLPGPNPSSGPVAVLCAIPEASNVALGVFDTQGRLHEWLHRGWLPAGRHLFHWDAGVEGRLSAPGRYVLRLETCGDVVSRAVTLVR
jgi:hypothetical protein